MKLSNKDKKDIINSALVLRQWQNTKNPFKIAKAMGIIIIPFRNGDLSKKGYSYYGEDKKEIWINVNLSQKQQIAVCTHELGHIALEHAGNSYYKDPDLDKDYCADLFAMSFLCLYRGLYAELYKELYAKYQSDKDIINLSSFAIKTALEKETAKTN